MIIYTYLNLKRSVPALTSYFTLCKEDRIFQLGIFHSVLNMIIFYEQSKHGGDWVLKIVTKEKRRIT